MNKDIVWFFGGHEGTVTEAVKMANSQTLFDTIDRGLQTWLDISTEKVMPFSLAVDGKTRLPLNLYLTVPTDTRSDSPFLNVLQMFIRDPQTNETIAKIEYDIQLPQSSGGKIIGNADVLVYKHHSKGIGTGLMMPYDLVWQWVCDKAASYILKQANLRLTKYPEMHIDKPIQIQAMAIDRAEAKHGEGSRHGWTSMLIQDVLGWQKQGISEGNHSVKSFTSKHTV